MTARVNLISPGYFHLLGIPLVQGRLWTESENKAGAHYAVINQAMERREFPNGDAVGRQVKLPTIEGRSTIVLIGPGIADAWLQIVGVVADARNDGLKNPVQPAIYVPETLVMWEYTQVLVKIQTAPAAIVHAIRTELKAVNADQQTGSEMVTLEDWIREEPEWAQEHLVAWIFGLFAGWRSCWRPWCCTAWCRTRWRSGPASSESGWRWARSAGTCCGSYLPRRRGAWEQGLRPEWG